MSSTHTSISSFLLSEQTLSALDVLRKGAEMNSLPLGGLSADDRTYLEAEDCVRSALYTNDLGVTGAILVRLKRLRVPNK